MGRRYLCTVVATILMNIGSALDGINGKIPAPRELTIGVRAKFDGVRPALSTKSWPCNHVASKAHNPAKIILIARFAPYTLLVHVLKGIKGRKSVLSWRAKKAALILNWWAIQNGQ